MRVNHHLPDIGETIVEVTNTDLMWAKAHRELDLDTISNIQSDDYHQVLSDHSSIGKKDPT